MRLRTLRWALAATGVVLLAACTSNASPEPTASSSPSTPTTAGPGAETSLEVAVYGGAPARKQYREVVDAFLHDHPGVKVHLVSYPSWAALEQVVDAKNGKTPDVFLADHTGLRALVDNGLIEPLGDPLVARDLDFGDEYARVAVQAFSADSDLQCMPNDVSPVVVFYNPKLVHLHRLARPGEARPTAADGWTWGQFIRAARRASTIGAAGVYIPPDLDVFGTLVAAAGGTYLDDDVSPTSVHLGDEASGEAVDQILGVIRNPNLAVTRAELRAASPEALFTAGKLAMFVGTRGVVPTFRSAGMSFDVMPLPKIQSTRSVSFMNGWCVASDSKVPDLAADFVAFSVGDDAASLLAKAGAVVPSNTDVLATDSFTIPGVGPGNGFVFLDSIQRSPLPPYSLGWESAKRVGSRYVSRLYYGAADKIPSNLVGLDAKVTAALTPPAPAPGS